MLLAANKECFRRCWGILDANPAWLRRQRVLAMPEQNYLMKRTETDNRNGWLVVGKRSCGGRNTQPCSFPFNITSCRGRQVTLRGDSEAPSSEPSTRGSCNQGFRPVVRGSCNQSCRWEEAPELCWPGRIFTDKIWLCDFQVPLFPSNGTSISNSMPCNWKRAHIRSIPAVFREPGDGPARRSRVVESEGKHAI